MMMMMMMMMRRGDAMLVRRVLQHAVLRQCGVGSVGRMALLVARRGFAAYPEHVVVSMPKLSPTMEMGNIAAWKKKEGESYAEGDVLAEVETDKATVSFEATDEGVIAKILKPEGTSDVKVGDPIAISVDDESLVAAFKDYAAEEQVQPPAPTPAKAAAQPAPAGTTPNPPPSSPPSSQSRSPSAAAASMPNPSRSHGAVLASPYAKFLAREQNKTLDGLIGSYPGGFVVSADLAQAGSTRMASQETGDRKLTMMSSAELDQARSALAEQFAASKREVPHYYLKVECKFGNFREFLGDETSLDDLVIKAAAAASVKVPAVNSTWMGATIRQFADVDINVALETKSGYLATPVLRQVERRGLSSIAKELKELKRMAQEDDISGMDQSTGTFTIMMHSDVSEVSAIIRPPQSAVLTIGAVRDVLSTQPQFIKSGKVPVEKVTVEPAFTATLSCDHRVVDGAVGARWLAAFKSHLESPFNLLL
ncbi:Dihydrolipoyllysine-residue acetyltransferase component 3 [Porphyridium purpureum]|uniref:Dihydrolipoamide acetyltransferase component of pyruvate dehydrogenase complex n=1 Tax=Porphyridium purpureum TaxID=35688 RepID=A0A5J4YPU0_PORPP|nr:Dihydrolipoyllysine-residue acetyltransferase component 3 [Porphyridium purpureum]|eukprot:POR5636..scf222_8